MKLNIIIQKWKRSFGFLLMEFMTVTERNLYVLCFASREGIRILESRKFLLVESRILDFGILNTVQGI